MEDRTKLGIGEFLADLRLVMTSPKSRFAVIHERSALWGSLVLMIVPLYIGFHFVGGIYFDRDPIPGYSWILPAVPALLLTFLKLYIIHAFARLLQGRGRREGTLRDLAVVFGYTSVPYIMVLILAMLFFLAMTEQVGALFRNFRIVSISIMVAVSVAMFVWNLILTVLAMRTTYPMRDFKIVVAFLLGSIVLGLPASYAIHSIAQPTRVDFAYVQPILTEHIARFFTTDPTSPADSKTEYAVNVDRIVYGFEDPGRFELIVFTSALPESSKKQSRGSTVTVGRQPVISHSDGYQIAGRIVGLPGDRIELVDGELRINDRAWMEPYIVSPFQSSFSVSPHQLGPAQYFVLPEDRRLAESMVDELVVDRARITGRVILNRYPFGWWLFRSGVFLKGSPET
jgi:hypothetical protein